MRYLIALFFPWLSFFTMGKVIQGIICLFLQITILGWLPATIWAFFSISNYNADKRTDRIVHAVNPASAGSSTSSGVPTGLVLTILGGVALLAFCEAGRSSSDISTVSADKAPGRSSYSTQATTTQSAASSSTTTTRPRIGPSFDCTAPAVQDQPLAQIICLQGEVARAELSYVIAFQALRQTLSDQEWKTLRAEADSFVQNTTDVCGIPKSGKLTGPPSSSSVACVVSYLGTERSRLMQRLTGDAYAEARLTPEQTIDIQSRLQTRGFLPGNATIDGVFGPVTRKGIRQWQRSVGQPETGFASASTLTNL